MSVEQPHLTELYSLSTLVNNLRDTSSSTEKRELLAKAFTAFPALAEYFRIVHDPFRKHYLSSKVAVANAVVDGKSTDFLGNTVFDALNLLASRKVTGHAAERMWTGLLIQLARKGGKSGVVEIANCLLDMNFKCHVGTKLVNKVLVKLGMETIRTFKVALGEAWKGERVWAQSVPVYCSRKLDGIRLLAIIGESYEDGVPSVRLVSRTGKPFTTLKRLRKRLKQAFAQSLGLPPCVLDGEVALRNPDGRDDFKGIMKEIRRKDHTIKNPIYHCFDFIPLSEFQNGQGEMPFRKRQAQLKEIMLGLDPLYFTRVRQKRIRTDADFAEMQAKVRLNKWEGLILRKGSAYLGCRSTDIYKVKKMLDLEGKVVGIKVGPFETNDGGTKVIQCMTAAFIRYTGIVYPGRHKCKVGSGWTLDQRKEFYKHPERILESIITVQYFEESIDKDGKPSLRFPVVKIIHGKKRTT